MLFVILFGLSMDYHVFVLLPASMNLLGDWNWYLPHWLGWLPKLEHHTEPALQPVPAAA